MSAQLQDLVRPTKAGFFAAYADELSRRYPWASDPARVAMFVDEARKAAAGERGHRFSQSGEAALAAWRSIHGVGRTPALSLRALAALDAE